jgi:hypothetical protein
MIGNSVSPMMAEAIFCAIRDRLAAPPLPMNPEADDGQWLDAAE